MKKRIFKRVEACVLAGFLLLAPLSGALPAYAAEDVAVMEETSDEAYDNEGEIEDECQFEDAHEDGASETISEGVDEGINNPDENAIYDADESDLPPDETVLEIIEESIEEAEDYGICLMNIEDEDAVVAATENTNSNATDVVVGDLFDLTDFYTGAVASHNCSDYLKKVYDGNNHWNQCTVCEKKYDIKAHSYTKMGSDSCGWWNSGETRYCAECGYQTVYKRAHTDDKSKWCTRPDQKYHYYKCTYCDSYGSVAQNCVDSKGNMITCAGGTCAICGYTYGATHTQFNSRNGESNTISCSKCGVDMIKFDSNTGYWSGANSYNASVRITWWNTSIFGSDANALAKTVSMGGTGGGVTGTVSNLNAYAQNGCIYASCTITYPYEERAATWSNQVWSVQPYSTRIAAACNGGKIENVAPTIQSANITYGTKNGGYSTKATLTVTCTDNWNYNPNFVQVRLLDPDKKELTNWLTCGKSGSTFSQTIDVVTEVKGTQNYYVQARDAGGNVSEKAVAVTNLDSKAPTVTSAMVTSEDWSKMKTITVTVEDVGAGDVSIAFNDLSDYKKATVNGNTYSRSFTFTGEVYGSAKAAIYIKDAVGNVTTEFVQIYNLDNTKPTIELTDISDAFNASHEAYAWNVTPKANDVNATISKSGSGIAGYALTREKTEPVASSYKADSTLLVTHSGRYYLWVKDGAGNVAVSDTPIVIHSDLLYNGIEINGALYNGRELNYFRYNGKLIRL